MASLISSFKDGIKVLSRKDDDRFDRINNRYTIAFLLTCSIFLAARYFGDAIDCFVPKEFADNWVKYADNYCWIRNTYYIPTDKNLPEPTGVSAEVRDNAKPELAYYQWVPIILAFMVFIFSIPVFFWKFAMASSGYDIQAIVTTTLSADNLDPKRRDDTCEYIVNQLNRHISYHRKMQSGRLRIGKGYGRYLFIMYIVTKCLYILVPIFLMYCLSWMMGPGFGDYGIMALRGLALDDGGYAENPMFPRITLCDFDVRRMGENYHRYTTQCVISVNMFNEKVFLIIWWWIVVLIGLNCVGLLVWLWRAFIPNSNTNFIFKFLKIMGEADSKRETDHDDVRDFTKNFLRLDGVFCMRLVAQNVTDVIAAEIVTKLYKRWKKERSPRSSRDGSLSPLNEDTV